jgi:sulfite exporter TauE/SafE
MELAGINSAGTAFIAGLVTSLHCAGMCGPLACSLMPVRSASGEQGADPQTITSVYHVSRMAAYATLGALGGAIGRTPLTWISESQLKWVPWVLVAFFLAMAFRLDRYIPKLAFLGRMAWRVQRWGRSRSQLASAASLGFATPLLPCGPLYFVVALAMMSGSALRGVEFMLAFGLGTVPLLWLAQTQFQWVRQKLSPLWLNRTRVALALVAAVMVAWRLRATLGLPGPDPSSFVCH